jgi:hypothetical protein
VRVEEDKDEINTLKTHVSSFALSKVAVNTLFNSLYKFIGWLNVSALPKWNTNANMYPISYSQLSI